MSRPRPYAELREPTAIVSRVPARRAPLWARPLGYGALTIVWLVLLLLSIAVTVLALPLALIGASGDGELQHAPMFARSDWPATVVVIAVLVAPLIGVLTMLLGCASLGTLLSAATLFVRSLRPRYRDERLSFSFWSRGETAGPVSTAFTGTATSLLPIRMTRWTKVVTIIRFNGWVINAGMFVLGPVWGIGYFWTVGWTLWPAEGAVAVVCAAGSGVVALLLLGLLWRRRHRYAEVMPGGWQDTPYGRSWPNRPEEGSGRRTG
jgi:hypothetical protein